MSWLMMCLQSPQSLFMMRSRVNTNTNEVQIIAVIPEVMTLKPSGGEGTDTVNMPSGKQTVNVSSGQQAVNVSSREQLQY